MTFSQLFFRDGAHGLCYNDDVESDKAFLKPVADGD